jgi:hypothetical protein
MVISKWRDGLQAPGFFDCAARLGRFVGDATGPDVRVFHAAEFNAALAKVNKDPWHLILRSPWLKAHFSSCPA